MKGKSEFELKFRLDAGHVERFASLKSNETAKPKRSHLHSVYYDDRRRQLACNGFELRVRTDRGHHYQTLKSGAGLDRGEWEAPVKTGRPSMAAVRATPARKLLGKRTRLEAVFNVQVDRQSWELVRDGSKAEITLDTGRIEAGQHSQPIAEAEFELKDGSPAILFDLARVFTERCDAPLSFVGKAMRGRRLESGRGGCPEHGLDLRLDSNISVGDAFAPVMTACLQQMSINEEILRADSNNIEAVHEMRVAVRRIRAALSLFGKLFEDGMTQKIDGELKWISGVLGKVRDLDVLLSERLNTVYQLHPGVSGVRELVTVCEIKREKARQRVGKVIRTLRFRTILLALIELVHAGAWRRDTQRKALRDERFKTFARRELNRRLQKVGHHKNRTRIAGHDELERHHIRIRAKKLRYMAEFVEPIAKSKSFKKIVAHLKVLQQALGEVHDGVAAEQLIGKMLKGPQDIKLVFAAGLVWQGLFPTANCIAKAVSAHRKLERQGGFG